MHTIGSQLMRSLFAYVDKTENFTFTFLPGISDSDIYPGMRHLFPIPMLSYTSSPVAVKKKSLNL